MIRQGTPAWHDVRRVSVSSTDLAVILGLSPYKSEWDLAAEKTGELPREAPTLPMKVGLALEPLIKAEYELVTGERLRRVHTLARHPSIEWAVASLDYSVIGKPWLAVETKWSLARRWADGLPQDVEAQVVWAMGCAGKRRCDVAALVGGTELRIHQVEFDADTFEGLVEIAQDFRARLAAGGPFAETADSVRRRYPVDDGTELMADAELVDAVATLIDVRGRRKALAEDEERLEAIVKARMGEAAVLIGPGWRVNWRRTKDLEQTDWRLVAEGALRTLPEAERDALVSLYTSVKEGYRPFRLIEKGTP